MPILKDDAIKTIDPNKPIKLTSEKPLNNSKQTPEVSTDNNDIQELTDEFVKNGMSGLLTIYSKTESSPDGFCDVVGMDEVKQKLQEDLIDYITIPDRAELDWLEYGLRTPRGYLFYGPPGCGKTYITQALAQEADMAMFKLDISKAGSKYVNQTANNIEKAFSYIKLCAKKTDKPILLFMDEVDSLAIKRDGQATSSAENLKTTTTLLKLLDEARDSNIIVIAATNQIDILDDAFKERFDGQMYFPLPDKEQIKDYLITSLLLKEKGENLAKNEDDIEKLTNEFEGYSTRAISFMLEDAAKRARRNQRRDITFEDVKSAIENSEQTKHDEKQYKKNRKTRNIGFNA